MTLLDKLERRFGFLGIPGLIRIVIGFTALVYVLVYLNRGFESFLTLDPALILRGQVWRLVTYIFLPQTFSPYGCFSRSGFSGLSEKASNAPGGRSGSRSIFSLG